MARQQAWVVYPDGVERVEIVRRGAAEKLMVRPVEDPVTVEDGDGDKFVVPFDSLYNDPVSASVAQAELAQRLGLRANPAETDDDPDSDPDNELDEEEDEDEEDEDEEDED